MAPPTVTVADAGAIVTVVGTSAATTALVVRLAGPLVAVMVAVPAATAVTVVVAPVGVTVNTVPGAALQLTGAFGMIWLFKSRTVAVNDIVPPTVSETVAGVIAMVAGT